MLESDRQLLEQFRRGESQALEKLYDAYIGEIVQLLQHGFPFHSQGKQLYFRGYKQPFDLHNALQETFLKAFSESARQTYNGLTPYLHYLKAIARNVVLSDLRKVRHEFVDATPLLEPADSGELQLPDTGTHQTEVELVPTADTPEHTLLQHELADLFEAFKQSLPARKRTFFEARFEQKLTQIEAAKTISLSHMQSRRWEIQLKQQLLEFMQEKGHL